MGTYHAHSRHCVFGLLVCACCSVVCLLAFSVVLKMPNVFADLLPQIQAAAITAAAAALSQQQQQPPPSPSVSATGGSPCGSPSASSSVSSASFAADASLASFFPRSAEALVPFLQSLGASHRRKIALFLNQYYTCQQLQHKSIPGLVPLLELVEVNVDSELAYPILVLEYFGLEH